MVLESLIDPLRAKQHPFRLFFLGLLFASIGVLFSLWIFQSESSIVMVFLTVMIAVPLLYATMSEEEHEDWVLTSESRILREHSKAILFLLFLFLGFLVGYAGWYVLLPAEYSGPLFEQQVQTIQQINSHAVFGITGSTYSEYAFVTITDILANNLKVMLFCVFFSFFFGSGAIFIIAWNASVIAAAVGDFFHTGIGAYLGAQGFGSLFSYFSVFSLALFRFMLHGSFEIIGYLLGGLAGGIISMAIIRHGISNPLFKKVMYDAALVFLVGAAFLIVGALVEVLITPLFFM